MDFKVKLFNSANLDEIDTRRLKIDVQSFKLYEFLLYLKSLHDIGEAEAIYVLWKNESKWTRLSTDEQWNMFLAQNPTESKTAIKLNIYYGNVHVNITCDICGYIVIGDRYKCLQCDNFDICQLCFQEKPRHQQHCFLLLRTPEDALKMVRSVPMPYCSNGVSDFRVIDPELESLFAKESRNGAETELTPDQAPKTNDEDKHGLGDNCSTMNYSVTGNLSSISKDYYDKLPENIHQGLDQLRSMGFLNMDGPLIALLIEKNGNICDVVDELEFSLKK